MAQGWYVMIMANDGTGRFRRVLQERSPANLHSMTAADFDKDGDVDLFICGRNPATAQGRSEGILGTPIPYHDANIGGPNILLRNDGSLQFSDVTKQVGLDANNRISSLRQRFETQDANGLRRHGLFEGVVGRLLASAMYRFDAVLILLDIAHLSPQIHT